MGAFKGIRTKHGSLVTFNDSQVELRLDIKNHSPMGFEWGYSGSGSKQLALAMLSIFISGEALLDHYKNFCDDFIVPIQGDEWKIDEYVIREWLNTKKILCDFPFITPRFQLKPFEKSYILYLDEKFFAPKTTKAYGYNTLIDGKKFHTCCYLDDFSSLIPEDLPENLVFTFFDLIGHDLDDIYVDITNQIRLDSFVRRKNKLIIEFWLALNTVEFEGDKNPKKVIDKFEQLLSNSDEFSVYKLEKDINGEYLNTYFSLEVKSNENQINLILDNVIQSVLNIYDQALQINENDTFEAIFNFPKEYQTILKQL